MPEMGKERKTETHQGKTMITSVTNAIRDFLKLENEKVKEEFKKGKLSGIHTVCVSKNYDVRRFMKTTDIEENEI